MKNRTAPTPTKPHGERTGTVCPVCGDAVLKQETFDRSGKFSGNRLVCSKRGCPWKGSAR